MEQATHQLSSEESSLLMLNDDCIEYIFKFLDPEEFVNLAMTCRRLSSIAQQIKKFQNIKVTKWLWDGSSCTVKEFAKILPVIAVNLTSVYAHNDIIDSLKTIAKSYTKTGIEELDSYYSDSVDGQLTKSKSLFGALPFRNLKELTVRDRDMLSYDEWKIFFENNSGIENLEYNDWTGRNSCLPLLRMLTKLKSLKIIGLETKECHHLTCLTSFTKFSFVSSNTCQNQLLIEIAKKLNLMELKFYTSCDAETFVIVKSFLHLEVLSITNIYEVLRIPENAIFPLTLKKIKLAGRIEMSCSVLLSIVKQLTLLEEFYIGRCGHIFCDNNEDERFPHYPFRPDSIQRSKTIPGIAKELRELKRNIKIIVDSLNCQDCKFSQNLEIIMRPYVQATYDHTFKLV